MIKNKKQYEITKSRLDEFEKAASDLKKRKKDPAVNLVIKSIQGQMVYLKKEMEEYDDLKSGARKIKLGSIDEFIRIMIKSRISLGISEKQLGELVGVSEQEIQKYESNDYESADIALVKEIIYMLNLESTKHTQSPNTIRSHVPDITAS